MRNFECGRYVSLILLMLLLSVGGGVGQEMESELVIPRSVEGDGIYSHLLALIVDGRVAQSGSARDGEACVLWDDAATSFTIDLGRAFSVTGLLVQVDGDDDYRIDVSREGNEFELLLRIDGAWGNAETGMETWSSRDADPGYEAGMVFEPVEARYLRIQGAGSDSGYALAEFQVMGHAIAGEEEIGEESPAVLLRPVSVDSGDGMELEAEKIIDGIIPPEGSDARAAEVVFWETGDTVFTVDLGMECEISGIRIQVDHDDDYHIDSSIDGVEFFPLVEITGDDGEIADGMDTMNSAGDDPEFIPGLTFFPVAARYIRIYGVRGDGFALSEIQFFGRSLSEPLN